MKKKGKKNLDEPCTSDGIKLIDFKILSNLSAKITSAHFAEDAKKYSLYTSKILDYLDKLEKIYGKKPSITASRADRVDGAKERKLLFLKAWAEAKEINDITNMILIAESLVENATYFDEDKKFGKKWLKVLNQLVDKYGELYKNDKKDYKELKNDLNKLP